MNDPYIHIEENLLSKELCRDIIEIFDKEEFLRDARTMGGVNKNILSGQSCHSSNLYNIPNWKNIECFVLKETVNALDRYMSKINKRFINYTTFNELENNGFSMNKYSVDIGGKYEYHVDRLVEKETELERMITFIWYLNDVQEGGETEFNRNLKVKPETGKLLMFPSTWTYPHSSLPVVSNNKYIIVGWFLLSLKKERAAMKKKNKALL